jgi:D-alanyl-D-alanine carboxypeptidase
LTVFVFVLVSQHEGQEDLIVEETDVPLAVTSPNTGEANQPAYAMLLHGADEVCSTGREKDRGLRAARAKRREHRVLSRHGSLHRLWIDHVAAQHARTVLSRCNDRGVASGKLLKDLPKPPPEAWAEVTLRQLLNHTSGLPDYTKDQGWQAALRASPTQAPRPEKLLTYVYDHDPPLLFDPGSEYNYSNSDNIVVGLMVEAATGRSYEEQLREQVYRPLGLRKTTLPRGPNLRKPFIHGYDNDPSQQPPEDLSEVLAAGWAWASGGMVSTPADLNDFIRGYVGGKLFDRQTRAKQRRAVEGGSSDPPGPGKNSAGLGIFRYETRCGTMWGHTGHFFGYTQFMAASPNGSRSVTVSINAQLTPMEGEPGVFEALRRAESKAVCAALAD